VALSRCGSCRVLTLAPIAVQVEYVKQEAKLVYLLECLQKTAPPVLVFAENKADVDDIHEYLLKQNVEAVAIHGGKEQDERNLAIDGFKAGKKACALAASSLLWKTCVAAVRSLKSGYLQRHRHS